MVSKRHGELGESRIELQGALLGRGRYRVLRLLDAGDLRQLYVVRDQRLERDAVLTRFTAEVGAQEWLRRATRTATRLGEHPGLLALLDVASEDDQPFLVCEYSEGEPLSHYQPASALDVLRIGRQLCDVLAHAHAREVTGIDLASGAIWVTRDGRVKIGDFGAGLALPARRDVAGDVQALVGLLRELLRRLGEEARRDARVAAFEQIPADLASASELESRLARIAESEALTRTPLPPAGTEVDETAVHFFGRQRELGVLRAALRKARMGQGQLILIGGDPGIGKTRITEEFARETRAATLPVLVARCHEGEGAPAYWPWVQVLRALARSRDPRTLLAQMGAGAPDLVQMAPELRALMPVSPDGGAPALDSEHARFRLFDSFAGLLREAARDVPLVLILDDLHWADRPSLALLAALARDLGGLRLLIVGTHRVAEVGPEHPLSHTLAALRREPAVDRLTLRGLPEADMQRLLEMLAGSPLPQAVIRDLTRESEGNPFFAGELFRHMIERGALQFRSMWVQDQDAQELGLPEGVSEVIERRLRNLSADCLRALESAAVVGRAFDAALLARVSAIEPRRLEALLDEAVSARVLERPPHAGESWRFVHALIRETLYQHLSDPDRVAWHRRIAAELESLAGPLPVVELAHHYRQSLAPDTAERALHYSRMAGEDAAARFAYEEAVAHYTYALEAGAKFTTGAAQRVDLRLRLADALRCAGDSVRAKETYVAVADEARAAGLGPEQARAALGLGSVAFGASWWANLAADPVLLRMLRDARRAAGGGS